ncbi:MAG: carbohydrate binding domain-containing protein [Dehalococcoidales bacterium]|nr:carbohydrate binding domain-containing protein [Dehalococcoidales bacterium]
MAIDLYKFYIVQPQAGRNYVTNPHPYAATTGYTNYNGSMALDDTYTRRGSSCLKITPQTNIASGVFYSTVSVTSGLAYAFSVDVKGVKSQAMRIYIANSAGTAKATTTFTATGNWQRISVTHTAAETKTDYRLYVVRDSVASTSAFWVDGFQFEQAVKATTWIYGYERGLGYIDDSPEYGWEGAAGSSVSWRNPLTRHGGALVDIATYADIVGAYGLGMGPFEQVTTPIVTGGSLYQKHIRQSRQFSLALQYYGDTLDEIQQKRKALLNLLRPDYTSYDQPLVIRYQGYDVDGNEASDPVDIVCVLETCHTDPPNSPTHQEDVLTFTVLDGHLQGAFKNGTTLDYKVEFVADYIVRRDPNGSWVTHAGGGVYVNPMAGIVGGMINDIKEAPNGDIYVCGGFTSVKNGATTVTGTAGIARWSKVNQEWEAVGNANTGATISEFRCMEFDAAGNLYAGGSFQNLAGNPTADYFAKYTVSTNTWSSLGGGIDNGVRSIAISPEGVIYIGGQFGSISGNANCKYIAYWNGSAWAPLANGLDGGFVNAMKFIHSGILVIGGGFQKATGTAGDYICYWDGTAFHSFTEHGASELNPLGFVYSIDTNPQGTIVIGGAFSNAGGDPNADFVAAWRGTNWGALQAGGVDGIVRKVYCDPNSDIYLAGEFKRAGNVTLSDQIVVSKGGAFQPLDIDLPGTGGTVWATAICKTSDGYLYLGGGFNSTSSGIKAVCTQPANIIYETATSTGSANTYPEVAIVGPGTLQSISNFSTGQKITFDGLTLLDGERITLHLDPTALTMKSSWSGRGSVWRYLNAGSDIGNWFMQPGANSIGVFIPTGFDVNKTKVYITWKPKYWSIEGAVY